MTETDEQFLDRMARASTDYPPDYDRDRYDDFYREAAMIEAEQDHAARWMEAWDRLAPLGIVGPEDRDMSLCELERLASYLEKP